MTVYLHGLSTAVPPFRLLQDDARDRAAEIFGASYPNYSRLAKAFDTAGIAQRFSVVPLDWFSTPQILEERNRVFLESATQLFIDAAERALNEAGWDSRDVDCVLTVCSTGIATPSLDARAFGTMGFRQDVMRVPLFGLGCAGGVSGLATARSLAKCRPGQKVLMVAVETCSLHFRMDRGQKADVIAAVLFGDGAAAACLSMASPNRSERVVLGAGVQKTWPDTLSIMGWDVDDTGLGVVFDRSIPAFVSKEISQAAQEALTAADLDKSQIDRYVCHPGGARVVVALERALDLEPGALAAERDVLRSYGNMSSPTVLFVMKDILETGGSGQMMACALGPGFTASFLPVFVEQGAG